MKLIITATSRKNSRTLFVAKVVKQVYQDLKENVEILDLSQIPFQDIVKDPYSSTPDSLKPYLNKVEKAEGLIIVCPTYNGGFPGLMKHFMDYWIFPKSFVCKPVSFVGLASGNFGGLTPVSHLQDLFIYLKSFVFPMHVFIPNIEKNLKEGEITNKDIKEFLQKQAINFTKFTAALKTLSFT